MSTTVVVADDQAVVRDGIRLLLGASGDIDVLAVAADGVSALEAIRAHSPVVALVDLRMPGLDGAGVAAAVAAEGLATKVVILTTYAEDAAVLPALRAGAAGYLTKDVSAEDLLAAVHDVAAGRMALDPAVQARLVQLAVAEHPVQDVPTASPSAGPEPTNGDLPEGLTRREVDVIRKVAEGLTNAQVARDLYVSEATVKTHLNHVLAKLGLEGRSALVAWAWRRGMVDERG